MWERSFLIKACVWEGVNVWLNVFSWATSRACLARIPQRLNGSLHKRAGELKISWQGPRNVQWQRPDHSLALWLPLSPPTRLWNGLPRCWVTSTQKRKVDVTFSFNAQEGDLPTAHHRFLRAKSTCFYWAETFQRSVEHDNNITALFHVVIYDFKSFLRTNELVKKKKKKKPLKETPYLVLWIYTKNLQMWLFCDTRNSKALILRGFYFGKEMTVSISLPVNCLPATSENTVLSLLVVKPAVDNFLDCEPNPSQMGYQLSLLSQLSDAPWHYNSSLQNSATFSTAIWWINRKYF